MPIGAARANQMPSSERTSSLLLATYSVRTAAPGSGLPASVDNELTTRNQMLTESRLCSLIVGHDPRTSLPEPGHTRLSKTIA